MRQKCLFFFVLMCVLVGSVSNSGATIPAPRDGKSHSGNSDSTPFTMVWETIKEYEEIHFFVKGDGEIKINWGDGDSFAFDNVLGGIVSHFYVTPGKYNVSITGLNKMDFYYDVYGCGEKLREVTSWGGVEWISMAYMFFGCSNLTTLPSEAPDLSKVEDMEGMFYGTTNFNHPLYNWGARLDYVQNMWSAKMVDMLYTAFNVKHMLGMFQGATNFNQDISSWDVSNVKNMSGMFQGATN